MSPQSASVLDQQQDITRASFSCPSHCCTLLRLGRLSAELPKSNLMGRMEAAAREGRIRTERESIFLLFTFSLSFCRLSDGRFLSCDLSSVSGTYKPTDQTVFSGFSAIRRYCTVLTVYQERYSTRHIRRPRGRLSVVGDSRAGFHNFSDWMRGQTFR